MVGGNKPRRITVLTDKRAQYGWPIFLCKKKKKKGLCTIVKKKKEEGKFCLTVGKSVELDAKMSDINIYNR